MTSGVSLGALLRENLAILQLVMNQLLSACSLALVVAIFVNFAMLPGVCMRHDRGLWIVAACSTCLVGHVLSAFLTGQKPVPPDNIPIPTKID